MDFINALIATGLSFVFLVVVFLPMEKAFPAKAHQRFFRPDWVLDLCFFLGQYLLWGGIVFWLLSKFNIWLNPYIPLGFRELVGAQPWWLQVTEVVLVSDFIIYWAHRLQHRVGFLWRFHKVHHSSEHLDWLAAHREHPLDTVYTVGLLNLPAFLMGFSLEALAGFYAFRGIWAIYIHSNVRLPLGFMRMVIGSPELHHWHHYLDRDAGNYANVSPLMDVIFGTYVFPDHEPDRMGITEPFPKNYVGQMLLPLLPNVLAKKIVTEKNTLSSKVGGAGVREG